MVFVFGSNWAGRHGKGAALFAKNHHGAKYGQGDGLQGNSYAIPTKGYNLENLDLNEIEVGIGRFLDFARGDGASMDFELTPIGTGLAGHRKRDLWGILKRLGVPRNVFLSSTWVTE